MAEKPRKARRTIFRYLCRECGERFETSRIDRVFRSARCRKTWNNRRQVRGGQFYDLAMKYRDQRGKGDLAELCHAIDRFLREDRASGRKTYSDKPEGLARR